jgi:transcriptional regulator with XRE-family HTH domain
MKFSEKLQRLRKENNLSQEQLADKLDVSRQSVSKWESGQTYPEMDKLLTMCKLFNITLDDLTNDEVNYKEVKPKNKNTFDNLVDDVMYIIDKTFCMFTNMESRERGKCIGELIILFIVLLCFRLPFEYIISIGRNVIYHLPRGAYLLESLWSFMINIVYLILFIFTFLYIYKTYFLDKYKEKEVVKTNDEKVEKKETIEEKKENNNKTIKEKKIKNHNFGTTLFEILGAITSFCFKIFLIIASVPFIISFIALFIAFFLLIILLFKGILYFGFIIVTLAAIILNWILLKLIASFLFGYKPKFTYLFTSFIIGAALLGTGTGLSIFEIMSTDIYNEAPKTKLEYVTKTFEYDNNTNLIIDNYYIVGEDIKFITDENLTNEIKIEVSYYKDLTYLETYERDYDKFHILEFWQNGKYNKEIFNLVINNLKKKKIYDYSKLYTQNIKIISSQANIENLKKLSKEYSDLVDYNYNNSEIYYYQKELENLHTTNTNLENQIYDLTNKITELQDENENLKNKIKEYKENLENILD